MKLSTLLSQRTGLLRQARLANVAFAHQTLLDFTRRAARAHLRGDMMLQPAAPDEGRYCAALTPLTASPSVVEEHFTEEDLLELGDVLAFALGKPADDLVEITFRFEEVPEQFLAPLRRELTAAGVDLDEAPRSLEEQNR